jgi:hypothetical protein
MIGHNAHCAAVKLSGRCDCGFADLAVTERIGAASNVGHGHVFPRPDGVRARCGGPGICKECAHDAQRKQAISAEAERNRRPGCKLVPLPHGAQPVAMQLFQDRLYIATTEGVYWMRHDLATDQHVFTPVLFEETQR